jgi:hypothetical protein
MARQQVVVTIEREGRDQGKQFEITEMSAFQAEWWAARLLMALARGNVDVPEGFFNMGWQAIAVLGIKGIAGLQENEARPLLNEMMACVRRMRGTAAPQPYALIEDDIEDVSTLFQLREAWMNLHLGFSLRDRLTRSTEASRPQGRNGQSMSTSPGTLVS